MRSIFTLLLGALFFSSCTTQKRAVYNYLEDITDTSFKTAVFITEPVIQKNDLISIQINSASLDPTVDALYNMQMQQGGAQNQQMMGYLVDLSGNIEMPRIGVIHAEGLTKSQLTNVIKEKLKNLLTQPSITIRFINYRITVLGEVGNPGILTIPTERLTILEAVGMAGGVTEFGRIKEVKVLRENDGVRTMGTLDLTSKKIFESNFYQLQQNDVILVDQNQYKLLQTQQQRLSQQISFALTLITTTALLFNIFR
jgi:polysaccharide biosynthesis/export protein